MKSAKQVIQEIAAESRSYDSMTDEELNDKTCNALKLIKQFEMATDISDVPNSIEIGKACCLLLTISYQYSNYKHWETVENLYSDLTPNQLIIIMPSVLALRDDYLKIYG